MSEVFSQPSSISLPTSPQCPFPYYDTGLHLHLFNETTAFLVRTYFPVDKCHVIYEISFNQMASIMNKHIMLLARTVTNCFDKTELFNNKTF